MFNNILLAVDFSKHSVNALKMAAAICEGKQRHLIVLTVYDSQNELQLEGIFGTSERSLKRGEDELYQKIVKRLKDFCLPLDKMGLHYEKIVIEGSPTKKILETAVKFKCDLIVIGSHSGRSIFDVLLGGTTAGVVKKAQCPLLVASLPEDVQFLEDIG